MNIVEIRQARNRGVVAYTKFCLDKKHNENCLFCFFEGEDNKYYDERILKYTNFKYSNIVNYNCGGKKQVIKVYHLIKNNGLNKDIQMAFFIDRDFEPYGIEDKKDIYQTPCYSIENFYCSVEAFKKIIHREFSLNFFEEDFQKCVNDYIKAQNLFHQATCLLNAWIFYQRQKENEEQRELVKLNDFKISKLFSKLCINEIEGVEIDLNLINEKFPNSYKLDMDRFNEIYKNFQNINQQQAFRGKFELEFLRNIIEDLRKKNKDKTYFSLYRDCVRIDVNVNPLSSLCQYADTPDCLISFLSQYKSVS